MVLYENTYNLLRNIANVVNKLLSFLHVCYAD